MTTAPAHFGHTSLVLSAGPGGGFLVLGHAGHWLVNLLYLAPVVGFLSWLGVVTWRERREAAAEDDQHQPRHNPKER